MTNVNFINSTNYIKTTKKIWHETKKNLTSELAKVSHFFESLWMKIKKKLYSSKGMLKSEPNKQRRKTKLEKSAPAESLRHPWGVKRAQKPLSSYLWLALLLSMPISTCMYSYQFHCKHIFPFFYLVFFHSLHFDGRFNISIWNESMCFPLDFID
jgi:hypothetical protein